jgi:hypothetical protein
MALLGHGAMFNLSQLFAPKRRPTPLVLWVHALVGAHSNYVPRISRSGHWDLDRALIIVCFHTTFTVAVENKPIIKRWERDDAKVALVRRPLR